VLGASAVPVDTDTVYFTSGNDSVTGTMNQSGIDLNFMYESYGFTGRVGSDSAPLQIDVNNAGAGIFEKGGPGTWSLTGTVWKLRQRAGKYTAVGGTIDNVEIYGGEFRALDGCDLNSNPITVKGGIATIDYKATDVPDLTIHGGVVYCYRKCGTITVKGGRLVLRVENVAAAATTVTLEGTGSIDWQAGDATTFNANEGTFTFANMVKPITLTNSNFTGASGTARTGANGLTVTYTNAPTVTAAPDTDG